MCSFGTTDNSNLSDFSGQGGKGGKREKKKFDFSGVASFLKTVQKEMCI